MRGAVPVRHGERRAVGGHCAGAGRVCRVAVARPRGGAGLCEAALLYYFTVFFFTQRMRERYLLPALVLARAVRAVHAPPRLCPAGWRACGHHAVQPVSGAALCARRARWASARRWGRTCALAPAAKPCAVVCGACSGAGARRAARPAGRAGKPGRRRLKKEEKGVEIPRFFCYTV